MQRLQFTVTEYYTIWNSITLIIAFNSLYNKFEMTTAPFLHFGNKDFKKIQRIVTSIKAANMAK